MMKIVCLIAAICAVVVLSEECFDKAKMKEDMKRYAEECRKELESANTDKQEMGKCVMRKQGIMDGDKFDYNKIVAKMNSTFTSESKKKIVLGELKHCKEAHPDMGLEFFKCYGSATHKECYSQQ